MQNGITFQSQVESIKERASAGESIIKALNEQVKNTLNGYKPIIIDSHSPYQLRVSFCGLEFLFRIELVMASDEASVQVYRLSPDELEAIGIGSLSKEVIIKQKEIPLTGCKFLWSHYDKIIKNPNGKAPHDGWTPEDCAKNVLDAVAAAIADKKTNLVLKLQ